MYNEKAPDISKELAKTPVTSIIEEVDCFKPKRVITIQYSGPNIRDIVRRAPGIIQAGMKTTGTRTYIDEYYIDVTDPNKINFHIFWHSIRGFDQRSSMWGFIKLKQGVLLPDGTGSVNIEFYAKVLTNWERETLIQRSPIYSLLKKIYTYVFYDDRRRKYLDLCKEWEEEMIRRMKDLLKLLETAEYTYA
jgi:hypothetical protein